MEWNNKKTIENGKRLNPEEAFARMGKAVISLFTDRDDIVNTTIMALLNERLLSIQLTQDLLIEPSLKNSNYLFHNSKYDVKFKGDTIFTFDCIVTSNKQYYEFEFENMFTISTEHILDFSNKDVEYLMKNFPCHIIIIKYVMKLFIDVLRNALHIPNKSSYSLDKYNYLMMIQLDKPINDTDKHLCNILTDIHTSNNRSFEKQSTVYSLKEGYHPMYNILEQKGEDDSLL